MNVTILPKETRTTIPINVEVRGSTGRPKLLVEGLGSVPFKKVQENYRAQFWVQNPGEYQVSVSDSLKTIRQQVTITQQTFLDFPTQFGLFFTLFIITMAGGILWLRKQRLQNG